MTIITRTKCQTLRSDMMKALSVVGELHCIGFKVGTISFTSETFTATVSAGAIGEDGVTATREHEALARLYPGMVDKPLQGGKYTLVGYKTRSPKRPWVIRETATGKEFITADRIVGIIR